MPSTVPRWTARSTPASAVTSLYRLTNPAASIARFTLVTLIGSADTSTGSDRGRGVRFRHMLGGCAPTRRCGVKYRSVPHYRISQAAMLLGVSDDTVRRWIDVGRLRATEGSGVATIDGAELAALAQEVARAPELGAPTRESARNRFTGLVTRVVKDTVMAQVDLQCGPFRVVSLMSAEAAEDLQLEPGVLAVASVKSTQVVVETPQAS